MGPVLPSWPPSTLLSVISPHFATTIAWHDGENIIYGLEGNIPYTGDAVAWMADSTGLSELTDAELALELNTLPASVDSTMGVYLFLAHWPGRAMVG